MVLAASIIHGVEARDWTANALHPEVEKDPMVAGQSLMTWCTGPSKPIGMNTSLVHHATRCPPVLCGSTTFAANPSAHRGTSGKIRRRRRFALQTDIRHAAPTP